MINNYWNVNRFITEKIKPCKIKDRKPVLEYRSQRHTFFVLKLAFVSRFFDIYKRTVIMEVISQNACLTVFKFLARKMQGSCVIIKHLNFADKIEVNGNEWQRFVRFQNRFAFINILLTYFTRSIKLSPANVYERIINVIYQFFPVGKYP